MPGLGNGRDASLPRRWLENLVAEVVRVELPSVARRPYVVVVSRVGRLYAANFQLVGKVREQRDGPLACTGLGLADVKDGLAVLVATDIAPTGVQGLFDPGAGTACALGITRQQVCTGIPMACVAACANAQGGATGPMGPFAEGPEEDDEATPDNSHRHHCRSKRCWRRAGGKSHHNGQAKDDCESRRQADNRSAGQGEDGQGEHGEGEDGESEYGAAEGGAAEREASATTLPGR